MFYFKFQETPLLARMEMIMEYFVDAWETLHDRNLSDEDREAVQAQFEKMYVTRDILRNLSVADGGMRISAAAGGSAGKACTGL